MAYDTERGVFVAECCGEETRSGIIQHKTDCKWLQPRAVWAGDDGRIPHPEELDPGNIVIIPSSSRRPGVLATGPDDAPSSPTFDGVPRVSLDRAHIQAQLRGDGVALFMDRVGAERLELEMRCVRAVLETEPWARVFIPLNEPTFRARVAAILREIDAGAGYKIEDGRREPCCPSCKGDLCHGSMDWLDHAPNCALAALLKETAS